MTQRWLRRDLCALFGALWIVMSLGVVQAAEDDFICEPDATAPGDPDPLAFCQTCLLPPGDVNRSAGTDVADVQCTIIESLYALGGEVGPPPTCVAAELAAPLTLSRDNVDFNCDGLITVGDVQISIAHALNAPLSTVIDANGDGCVDACLIDYDNDGVSNALDCSPFDPSIANAGVDGFEFCDGIDNNCDGQVDEESGGIGNIYVCDDSSFCSGAEECLARPSGTPNASQPFITELMIVPDASTVDGEFIELFNPTNTPIDLRNWRISVTSGITLQHTISTPLPLWLRPGGFVVLAASQDIETNGGVFADYAYSGIPLSDTAATVTLLTPTGDTADTVAYDASTWPTAGGSGAASMELNRPFIAADNSDYIDNAMAVNWHSAANPWRPETQLPDPANVGGSITLPASSLGSPGGLYTSGDVPGADVKSGGVPAPGYARLNGETSGPRCTTPADLTCAPGSPELGGQAVATCQLSECYDSGQSLPSGHPAGASAPSDGCLLRPNPDTSGFNGGNGCNDFFSCTTDACNPDAAAGSFIDAFGCAHTPQAAACGAPSGPDGQCVSAFCPMDPAGFDMSSIATGINLVDPDTIDRDTQSQTVEVTGCVVDFRVEVGCSDANACTAGETCGLAGQCDYFGPDPGADPGITTQTEADSACDDGLSCTGSDAAVAGSSDICVPASGACLSVIKDGTCRVETSSGSGVFECFNDGDNPGVANGFDRNTPCFVCEAASNNSGWSMTTSTCNADDSGCTVGDACMAGSCMAGSSLPTDCDASLNDGRGSDDLSCTVDTCLDASSDDWNGTTLVGAGTAYTCDNFFIAGVTPSGVPEPTLISGSCLIGGECWVAGEAPGTASANQVDDNSSCQICDAFGLTTATAGLYDWSPNTGGSCSDGFGCTITDVCTGTTGECRGNALDTICNDGNGCTADRCDPYGEQAAHLFPIVSGDPAYPASPISGCSFGAMGHDGTSTVNVACNDGDLCTFDDYCSDPSAGGAGGAGEADAAPGLCARGTDIDCNDTNDCTFNFCVGGSCESAPIPNYYDGEFSGAIPRPLGEVASSPPDSSFGYSVTAMAPYAITNPVATPTDPADAIRRCDLTDYCTAGTCTNSGFCLIVDDAAKCDVGASNGPSGWDPVDGDACSIPACDPSGALGLTAGGCYQSDQTSGPCDSSELSACDDLVASTCQSDGSCDVQPVSCSAPTPADDVAAVNQQCVTWACNAALGSTHAQQCIAIANNHPEATFTAGGDFNCDDSNSCTIDTCQSDGGVGAFCQRATDVSAPSVDPPLSALCVRNECHPVLGWNPSEVELARVDNPSSGVSALGSGLLGNVMPQLDATANANVVGAAADASLYADDLSNVALADVIGCPESPDDVCTGPDICQADGTCLTGAPGDDLVTINDYCASPLTNTLCVLSGAAGDVVRCPVRLAASSAADLAGGDNAFALQVDLYYNPARASLLQAEDRPCNLGAGFCLPEGVTQSVNGSAPTGSNGVVFPYGHQASFQPPAGANTAGAGETPNYLASWDTNTALKTVNTEDPTDTAGGSGRLIMVNASGSVALNLAYFDPAFDASSSTMMHVQNDAPIGATGSLDPEAPTLFELVFELQDDTFPNDPLTINASDIVVTRADSTLLSSTVWSGVIVTSVLAAPTPETIACGAEGDACSDGNDCTEGDTCDAGLNCVGTDVASGMACNGGNPCQTGTCDGSGACGSLTDVLNGTACDDGELCTFGDACQEGHCVPGTYFEGAECFDGAQCTFGEYCEAGTCVNDNADQFFCGDCDPRASMAPTDDAACNDSVNGGPENLACAFAGSSGEIFDCWLYLGGADMGAGDPAAVGVEATLEFDSSELTLMNIYDKGLASSTTPLSFTDNGSFHSTNFASMSSVVVPGLPFDVPQNRHSLLADRNPVGLGAGGGSTETVRLSVLPTVFDSGSGSGGGSVVTDVPLTNAYLMGYDSNGNPEFSMAAASGSNTSSGDEWIPGAYLRLRFRLDTDVSNDTPATVVYLTDDAALAGDGDAVVPLSPTAQELDYTIDRRVIVTEMPIPVVSTTPASCQAIVDANPAAADGTYSIDPDGAGPVAAFDAVCLFRNGDEGWTRVFAHNPFYDNVTYQNFWDDGAEFGTVGDSQIDISGAFYHFPVTETIGFHDGVQIGGAYTPTGSAGLPSGMSVGGMMLHLESLPHSGPNLGYTFFSGVDMTLGAGLYFSQTGPGHHFEYLGHYYRNSLKRPGCNGDGVDNRNWFIVGSDSQGVSRCRVANNTWSSTFNNSGNNVGDTDRLGEVYAR